MYGLGLDRRLTAASIQIRVRMWILMKLENRMRDYSETMKIPIK